MPGKIRLHFPTIAAPVLLILALSFSCPRAREPPCKLIRRSTSRPSANTTGNTTTTRAWRRSSQRWTPTR